MMTSKSEFMKEQWTDPIKREKRIENIKKALNKSETKEKLRKNIKYAHNALKDIEIEKRRRKKISKTMKKRIAESKEWQDSLKERGKESQFKKGKDKRREGRHQFTPETIERMRKDMKELGESQKGVNHPNWKGGVTSEHQKARNSIEYKEWRNAVYKKDYWTCQNCGIHCNPRNIVAHHIKSFTDYPEVRFNIDNGITYCRKCHNINHRT